MKEKGFTLVELLAVIVILATILAIAIPSVTNIVESARRNTFAANAKLLIRAIKDKKAAKETFDPTTINEVNIVSELKLSNQNYTSLDVSVVDGKIYINVIGANKWDGLAAHGTYDSIVVEDYSNVDNVPPEITILGDNPITISLNSEYVDSGATATDDVDGDITDNITVTSNVNTSVAGSYEVTYTVSDAAGNITTDTRVVTIPYEFNYTGNYQTLTLSSGTYIFELWGAKGGDYVYSIYNYAGGKGGYSKGNTTIDTETTLYLYVGGAGKGGSCNTYQGGWNGGGAGGGSSCPGPSYSGGGGGATDIRLVSGTWNNATSLASRIIVAGGGSGAGDSYYKRIFYVGADGGGVSGDLGHGDNSYGNYYTAAPGTQTTGYALGTGCSTYYFGRSGAGGGYYGGACLPSGYGSSGAGSGFVPGHSGVVTEANGFTFTDTVMTNGVSDGDGKIIITKTS